MPTDDNVADLLTKVLSQKSFEVIGSRSSGRLLEICPRIIVVITVIHVYVIFKRLIKAFLRYIVLFLITCVCKS